MSTSISKNSPPTHDADELARWVSEQTDPEALRELASYPTPSPIRRIVLKNAQAGVLDEEIFEDFLGWEHTQDIALLSPSMTEERVQEFLTEAFDNLSLGSKLNEVETLVNKLHTLDLVSRQDILSQVRRVLTKGPRPSDFCMKIFTRLPCWLDYTSEDLERIITVSGENSLEDFLKHHNLTPEIVQNVVVRTTHESVKGALRAALLWMEENEPDKKWIKGLVSSLATVPNKQHSITIISSLPKGCQSLLSPDDLLPWLGAEDRQARLVANTLIAETKGTDPLTSTRDSRAVTRK